MPPQFSLLPRRHVQLEKRRRVVECRAGARRRAGGNLRRRAARILRHDGGRVFRARRTFLQTLRHRRPEEDLGLTDELGFHIREDAVEIEADTKGHRRDISASRPRPALLP